MPSNHLILCHPLLPSVFSSIRVFSNQSAFCIRWPKHWSFSFRISLSKEYSVLTSFSWLTDFTSLLSKGFSRIFSSTTLLQCSAFFMVQLSHSYMTTGKTIPLIIQTLSVKWCLWFLILWSKFVTAFLPSSKSLLISWLQSPSEVILEPKKRKSVTASTFPRCICH